MPSGSGIPLRGAGRGPHPERVRRYVLAVLLGLCLLVGAPAEAGAPARVAACSTGRVSLTFDDGPSATVTRSLVRILRDLHVPATFFMVGERVASAPATARLVSRSGFLTANHSYRHTDMTRQSSEQVRATLHATDRRLRAAGARPTQLMRPPYGAINDRVRRAVVGAGYVPVLWDVDPEDWEGGSSATIAARILAQLRPHARNIVLQHDGIGNSPASVRAVPRVVREARSRGYCFVALDEQGRPGFPTPKARLVVTDVREGAEARATVILDRPTARTVKVRLATAERSAQAGADFASRDLVVRIPAGTLRRTVRIPVARDALDERAERFEVGLTEPFGVTLSDAQDVVTVADRNRPPRLSVADLSVPEPLADPATAEVRLWLGQVSGRVVRVRITDFPVSADATDYEPFVARVRIPAGRVSVAVPVTVLPDDLEETAEQLIVRVVAVRNARVADPEATVTIAPPSEPPPEPPPSRRGR